MPNIGPMELIIVLVIVLLIFGPKRLPGLGKQLGSGMREFKDSISGKDNGKDDDDDDTEPRRTDRSPAQVEAALGPPRGRAGSARGRGRPRALAALTRGRLPHHGHRAPPRRATRTG